MGKLIETRNRVMSFVRSGDLRSVLEKNGDLSEEEIDYLVGLLEIALQNK